MNNMCPDGFSLISRYRTQLMGFAALWILMFHEWDTVLDNYGSWLYVESFIKYTGFCGVDIFLFLSGIGLTFSIGKKSLCQFYISRIKRIFLPVALMGAIMAAVDGWGLGEYFYKLSGASFFADSIFSFFWFYTAILIFYIVFPLYNKGLDKADSDGIFTAVMLVLWTFLSVYFKDTMRLDLYGFTNRIPIFLMGIYMGRRIKSGDCSFTKLTWVLMYAMLALGLYLSYLCRNKGFYLLVPDSGSCIPNILIAVSLSFILARLFGFLSGVKIGRGINSIFRFYGTFSLELYLVQEWLGGKIAPHASMRITNNIAVFVLSTIFGYLLSKTALLFKRRG